MDIDLLSRMVKELILDNDKVALPGVGSFVAEMMPATFTDNGYTVNPPYRRLSFRQRLEEDRLLTRLYASSNEIDEEKAESILRDFLSEMKKLLFIKKIIVFPGLGRLRATKENTIFFVADENLDIFPEGIGLAPVSLKTHQESRAEIAAAVGGMKKTLTEGTEGLHTETKEIAQTETVDIPVGADELTESNDQAESSATEADATAKDKEGKAKKSRGWFVAGIIILSLIILVLIAALLFYVAMTWFPDLLDKLLYSKEELEIINYWK